MIKPVIMNSIRGLVSNPNIEGCIVLTKKGVVRASFGDIPDNVKDDIGTFLATIYGGAIEYNKLMNNGYPKKITVDDQEGMTILRVIDNNLFLAVRTKSVKDPKEIFNKIEDVRWTILSAL